MNILDYETVSLIDEDDAIEIIDQTLLPGRIEIIRLHTAKEIWDAIYLLQVRGAPAIGVTAGFGLYLLMKHSKAPSYDEFMQELGEKRDYLNSSRPTAVNLSWALKRMEEHVKSYVGDGSFDKDAVIKEMKEEASRIKAEDIDVCRRIGENGLTLIKDGDGLLTHCNAGALATTRYGTQLSPVYIGMERGMKFKLYVDETRPLLQGARLTAYELVRSGVDTTLLCDNMAGELMKAGKIDAVIVGADRIAANGDTANKIGTSALSVLANYYHVPLYVFAPYSTIDMSTTSGEDIVIEQRAAEELTEKYYVHRMAPEGIKVFNPAFDVTDHELISAIITDKGVLRKPYDRALKIFS